MDDQLQLVSAIETKGNFKNCSFAERFAEYQVLRCNYPGFVPICVTIDPAVSGSADPVWFKLYMSSDILVGHLRDFLRKLLTGKYTAQHRLLVVGEDVIVKFDVPVRDIYESRCKKDGWMYLEIAFDHQK